MTSTYTISEIQFFDPSEPGALHRYECSCSCGTVLRSSLRSLLLSDINAHIAWHETKARKEAPRKLRIVKAHIEDRRYVAVVVDYTRSFKSYERHLSGGRAYPHVYRASTDGWTRATREECYAWIAAQGSPVERIPQDRKAVA
jgi:hypothetical protein